MRPPSFPIHRAVVQSITGVIPLKLWAGGFHGELDKTADDFNSSISFDSRMAKEDIKGSVAHATMLGECGVLAPEEAAKICEGLRGILADLESGKLAVDETAEDVHTFVEGELTARLGDAGRRLHTARSRNDQVAVDLRLYLKKECAQLLKLLNGLTETLCRKALENKDAVMPGYTHMQRAQPVTFGHHMMAYAEMFLRDAGRLGDAEKRMDVCPLGACALAGTTYPLDRERTAELLGFSGATQNSLDAVSDRDFCLELASAVAICMVHLSRLAEEIILWCSWEFKFVELDDAFTTGSSIMPQKKNPDVAELVRGKTGRAVGDMVTLFTMMKGLPLAYDKDMQEDKEAIFDAVDTLKMCLETVTPMIRTMKVQKENMRAAAAKGFLNATDCADYLVGKGMPFRTAYRVTGDLVAYCVGHSLTLETLPLEKYREFSGCFDADIYGAISLERCVGGRKVLGGPAPGNVEMQAKRVLALLGVKA